MNQRRFDFLLFSRAMRPGFNNSSRSSLCRSLSALVSFILTTVMAAIIAMSSTAANATSSAPPAVDVGICTVYSPVLLAALILSYSLLALVLFHWVLCPFVNWVVDRWSSGVDVT